MASSAPPLNHLLFVDYIMLFFSANSVGAIEINQVMDIYYQATGQWINCDKSWIFFSKGVPEAVKNEIKGLHNVPNETLNEKYLGMLSDFGS